MRSSASGKPMARLLLVGLILAIGLGPRLRIPGLLDRAVDLRLQDFLLIPAALYVATRLPSLRPYWGVWALLFVPAATALTLGRLLLDPSISVLRTVAYLGRGLELLLLAAVVAALVRLAGPTARRLALGSLFVVIAVNFVWVVYQLISGQLGTLLNPDVGDLLAAYGPKLVGEGSAFGAGIFWAFTAALGCATWLNRTVPRLLSAGLIAAGAFGAYVTQSRVSLGAVAVCLVLLLFLPVGGQKRAVGAGLFAAMLIVLGYLWAPHLPTVGRLSEAGVNHSFGDRTGDWWGPLVDVLLRGWNPLTGIGVGRLGTDAFPRWTEAHNIALRAALDYGLIVGFFWLAIFFTAAYRSLKASVRPNTSSDARLWATLAGIFLTCVLAVGALQESLAAVTSTHLAMLALGMFAGTTPGATSVGEASIGANRGQEPRRPFVARAAG